MTLNKLVIKYTTRWCYKYPTVINYAWLLPSNLWQTSLLIVISSRPEVGMNKKKKKIFCNLVQMSPNSHFQWPVKTVSPCPGCFLVSCHMTHPTSCSPRLLSVIQISVNSDGEETLRCCTRLYGIKSFRCTYTQSHRNSLYCPLPPLLWL